MAEGFFRFYGAYRLGLVRPGRVDLDRGGQGSRDAVSRVVSCSPPLDSETYRSGDEYDRAAITHVMACNSHFPGLLLTPWFSPLR
jgi:hypothetical protein